MDKQEQSEKLRRRLRYESTAYSVMADLKALTEQKDV